MGPVVNKTALVVLAEGFEDIEASTCIDILNRADARVVISGIGVRPVHGAYGCAIISHTTIDKIEGIYDCLVFPGGIHNAELLAVNPAVLNLIQSHNDANKLIAAFSDSAAYLLARAAAILHDKKVSGDPAVNDCLIAGGAVITDKPVTVDNNIVTGSGPGAAMLFALEIVEHLFGKQVADNLAGNLRIARPMRLPEKKIKMKTVAGD
ncbi:MAG: DJ-1/PfpI family protein [candidate division Zixibacteria bacterium]|nr:DJ-1/PfpI family protein [candidate division Zixibacteria bacterium]